MGPKIFASGAENERLRWQESEDGLRMGLPRAGTKRLPLHSNSRSPSGDFMQSCTQKKLCSEVAMHRRKPMF
ncbi:uncharacterized protein Dsimw501_GD28105 [Drosophila simulans]|uniref:Uncharacterized protein n=1 Tax=Drosophila simulans TaxID=7240 RepID=A0A0J9RMS4_DROSI|nr:uncharacterized protein Dsimw501_GD28105 [Drosophila simulans]